ncbi:unnamed protein product [Cladocopium goreaui]|uniref:Uncharacterized protein n=1 Tax=Cladocopium goreaui TaxID=2562237 RepID=A0A9P1FVF6_9DINO|nr:unnamed protein product [Cladocopium goreaui]
MYQLTWIQVMADLDTKLSAFEVVHKKILKLQTDACLKDQVVAAYVELQKADCALSNVLIRARAVKKPAAPKAKSASRKRKSKSVKVEGQNEEDGADENDEEEEEDEPAPPVVPAPKRRKGRKSA